MKKIIAQCKSILIINIIKMIHRLGNQTEKLNTNFDQKYQVSRYRI